MAVSSQSTISEIADSHIDTQRTFHDLDKTGLDELINDCLEYVKNSEVQRLPSIKTFTEFLEKYPFFRVHGYHHNLQTDAPLEVYITGIEYVPSTDNLMIGFTSSDIKALKKRFGELFYDSDYLFMEGTQFVAEYYFRRFIESPE